MQATSKAVEVNFIHTKKEKWAPPYIGQQIQLDYMGSKLSSRVRGLVEGAVIIIDIPNLNGRKLISDMSALYSVRFFSGGSLFGFTAKSLNVYSDIGLMVLEYPRTVESIELRKTERINVLYPVAISRKGATARFSGAMLDLSYHGAMISVDWDKGFRPGVMIRFAAILPNEKKPISISAEIRSLKETTEKKLLLGLVFVGNDKESLMLLHDFFENNRQFPLSFVGLFSEVRGDFIKGQKVSLEFGKKAVESVIYGWRSVVKPVFLLDKFDAYGAKVDLTPGKRVPMSFEKDGKAIKITVIYSGQLHNEKLLLFAPTNEIEETNFRSKRRFLCHIPALITAYDKNGDEVVLKGLVGDISHNGLKVEILMDGEDVNLQRKVLISLFLGHLVEVADLPVNLAFMKKEKNITVYGGSFQELKGKQNASLDKLFAFLRKWIPEEF